MTHSAHSRFLNAGHFAVHYMLLIFPTAVLAIEKEWQRSYGDALQLGTGTGHIRTCDVAGWLARRPFPVRLNGATISLPKVFDERLAEGGLALSWGGSASALVFAVAAFAQLPVDEKSKIARSMI